MPQDIEDLTPEQEKALGELLSLLRRYPTIANDLAGLINYFGGAPGFIEHYGSYQQFLATR